VAPWWTSTEVAQNAGGGRRTHAGPSWDCDKRKSGEEVRARTPAVPPSDGVPSHARLKKAWPPAVPCVPPQRRARRPRAASAWVRRQPADPSEAWVRRQPVDERFSRPISVIDLSPRREPSIEKRSGRNLRPEAFTHCDCGVRAPGRLMYSQTPGLPVGRMRPGCSARAPGRLMYSHTMGTCRG